MKELALLFNKAQISFAKFKEVVLENNTTGSWQNVPVLTVKERERLMRLEDQKFPEQEQAGAKAMGIEIVDYTEGDYPQLLRQISTPPLVLYVRGDKRVLSSLCFAMVGTRLPTFYGIEMAKKFSYGLASLGFTIVSGLARGIDTAAHLGALVGGKTIAVLGGGMKHLYPKGNNELSQRISQTGAVISEFALDEVPRREYFPRRNRIVSGLSRGVLVVEAAQRSGALITARYALEQNREVFALPGEANSGKSRGPHILIKQGAKLVDSIEDILQEFPFDLTHSGEDAFSLSVDEKNIFNIITEGGISLEEMLLRHSLKRDIINKVVLSLQMKGLIKEAKPLYYVKAQL